MFLRGLLRGACCGACGERSSIRSRPLWDIDDCDADFGMDLGGRSTGSFPDITASVCTDMERENTGSSIATWQPTFLVRGGRTTLL